MQPHVGQWLSTFPFARPAVRTVPRPAGGRGRAAGTRASLLIAVSAVVLATVLATPGQANAQGPSQQTPQVLVSNIEQTKATAGGTEYGVAQAFRTGANTDGYRLIAIDLRLSLLKNPTVTLRRGSVEGSTVASFTAPLTPTGTSFANIRFTPTTNVTLDSDTDYWVVAEGGDSKWTWSVTGPAEDATPAPGWSIADRGQSYTPVSIYDPTSGGSWVDNLGDLAWQIAVIGTIIGGDSNSPATGASSRSGPSNAPLKARFENVPTGHDGSTAFTLLIAFNEPIKTTEAVLQALTVTGGTVTSAQEVGGLSDRWEITVTPNGDDDVRISLPPTTSCDDEGAICSYDRKVLQRGAVVSVPRAPLTARFESVPTGHDGSTAFALQLAFSEPIETTEAAIQQALMVTDGMVASVRQVDGRSDRWEITAMPNSNNDVSVSLPLTTSCNADNAICTAEGRMLLQGVAVSVPRAPLSARFENVPAGHGGSTAFALRLVFSEPIETTAPALTQALTVTGGRTIGSQRVKGRSDLWEITAVPNSNNDVSIALSSTTSCDADGAVCTQDGLALQNDAQAAIPFVGYVMPHSLAKVFGDDQAGSASTQLAEPFVVLSLDENGAAMTGVVVSFSVSAGGGMLSATTDANPCTIESSTSSTTATTDANGQASARLTLGSEPGTNTVSATVEGLEAETFTATATEQATSHSLTKVCGDDQEGTAGILLAEPFVVSVVDEDGAAIAGVAVSFSVTTGGGTLSVTTDTTNANGRARTRLTLGSDEGTNTVSATVEGLEPVTFTATGQESPLASFFDAFQSGSGKLVGLPDSPQLAQNAPNPFNSETVLSYFLLEPGPTRLEVFTLTGQRVAVLHQGLQRAGYHRLRWDGRDAAGHPLASGMYLYRLVTDEIILTRKLTLLR